MEKVKKIGNTERQGRERQVAHNEGGSFSDSIYSSGVLVTSRVDGSNCCTDVRKHLIYSHRNKLNVSTIFKVILHTAVPSSIA